MPVRGDLYFRRIEGGIASDPASPPGFSAPSGELPLKDSGTPGNASGATITATASIISGTAAGPATIAAQTITATASILAGTASGPVVLNGDTITASVATLLAGTAGGGATVDGQTIALTTDLIAGTADGGGTGMPGNASGDTITVTIDLITDGAQGAVIVGGDVIVSAVSLIDGLASGPVEIAGQTLVLAAEVIGGGATDGGDTPGVSFPQDALIVLVAPLPAGTVGPGTVSDAPIPASAAWPGVIVNAGLLATTTFAGEGLLLLQSGSILLLNAGGGLWLGGMIQGDTVLLTALLTAGNVGPGIVQDAPIPAAGGAQVRMERVEVW
jgi:hypothetical protein